MKHLQVLGSNECQATLGAHHLGRIGLVDERGVAVLPVNYVLDDDEVIFRTSTRLAGVLRDALVAFEIDGIDHRAHTGWSVLVRGRAHEVTDQEEFERLLRLRLVPWAPGERPHYFRIRADEITGRRIDLAEVPSTYWG